MTKPLNAIKGMRLLLRSMILPLRCLDILAPVAPVNAMAGTSMNNPGNTISDLTSFIDSREPNSSIVKVDVKNIATHKVAMIAAKR